MRRIVGGVVAAALAESGAEGVVVLDGASPEGELLAEWLTGHLGGGRVLGAEALAGDVQESTGWRQGRVLSAHPATRTALLLGGALPLADLLPLGDVWASAVLQMRGAVSLPADVQAVADTVGGVARLDELLARWIDGRTSEDVLFDAVDEATASRIIELYERGRYFRLRPRLVPKLGPRTLGIDLWD